MHKIVDGQKVDLSQAEIDAFEAARASTPAPRRVGTSREFLGLFTKDEKLAFFTAKRNSAELELWWAEASVGEFSLDHPDVPVGVAALVAAGVLTPAREAEILSTNFDE